MDAGNIVRNSLNNIPLPLAFWGTHERLLRLSTNNGRAPVLYALWLGSECFATDTLLDLPAASVCTLTWDTERTDIDPTKPSNCMGRLSTLDVSRRRGLGEPLCRVQPVSAVVSDTTASSLFSERTCCLKLRHTHTSVECEDSANQSVSQSTQRDGCRCVSFCRAPNACHNERTSPTATTTNNTTTTPPPPPPPQQQ